ncbi:dolabradiene monooxygenase-like [Phragmites australis]|uniref:dolabradiene monooxygenase-like n=1 Tax=Phragmites australis TaxID=29695 RepID=UPI002D764A42|nr:dolabradiene monooxygenase-like [Phragmites australis]
MEGKVLVAVAVVVLLVVLSKLKSLFVAKPKLNLPPGPWTLPVIGSIHHLITNPLIYRRLRELAQKHGPLMMLRLGEVPTLVVSSPEAAQAIMKTHDTSFADRFTNATLDAITYNATDLVFAPYGERWRQLRKICVLELLSTTRVQSFQRIREEEVARFIHNIATSAAVGSSVDMSDGINKFINDAFVRACVGGRCEYQEEYLDAFHMAVQQTSGLTVADLFPSSRIMQMLGRAPRKALAGRDRMQRILEQIIQENKESLDRGDKTAQESFIGVLLRLQNEGGTPIQLTNDTISSLMFDMFGAGSDTSASVLIWSMTELIRSPAAMAKVQAEVREAFKGKSTITEDDLARAELSYFKLVIKETLRLHTHLPCLIPRQCRETCQVMGYDIPKGTSVLVNVWAISRDPKYWDDPEEFKPERFEKNDLDYKGTNYEYLPFGSGRRMCPGINLGLANINLVLVSLLYHFDWKLPDGMEPKDVDVWETVGLIANKRTSLVLHPVTRIAPANA